MAGLLGQVSLQYPCQATEVAGANVVAFFKATSHFNSSPVCVGKKNFGSQWMLKFVVDEVPTNE